MGAYDFEVYRMLLQKIKILYYGRTHQKLFQDLTSKLEHWWLFKSPEEEFIIKSFADDDANIIIVMDSDFGDKFNFHKKLVDISSSTPFAILNILSPDDEPAKDYEDLVDYLATPLAPWRTVRTLLQLDSAITSKREREALERRLSGQSQELSELNKIGIALSAERDPDTLLKMILTKARGITSADAGSLYLVEKNPDIKTDDNDFWVNKQLRFKLAHNDSLKASYQEFVMPVQRKSMAGYAALTGKPLNIPDAYMIPVDSPVQHNRSFDEKMGYRTKSVLCIPMLSHQGETIGVLQLINRKKAWRQKLTSTETLEDQVIAFDERCEDLASSLASQAAVSIENMRLYEEIKRLFEGFIVASVHAIEQRDPTTSGHSERVAKLTVDLAKKIDRIDSGPYHDVHFSRDDIQQINYAALLHDFGKIGVRENVLVKAKKLYPEQMRVVKFRFKFIKKALELNYSQEKVKNLLENNREKVRQKFESLDADFVNRLKEIDNYLEFILEANEPRILAEGGYDKLLEISGLTYRENGLARPYLDKDEVHLLSITKGSLSPEERNEIESHVTHTYNFLSRIPWASHLKSVPQIAYAHHEKLDGSGYPRNLNSDNIPFPSKMMTIADIYDALTASDRPYKRAVPPERALEILQYERNDGKIDPELFRIFVESKVFEIVTQDNKD